MVSHYYREETIKHCYCGRCGKEINPRKNNLVIEINEVQLRIDNRTKNEEREILKRIGFPLAFGRGFYLCGKCSKDLSKFLKNTYKFDKGDRESDLCKEITALKDYYDLLLLGISCEIRKLANLNRYLTKALEDCFNITGEDVEEEMKILETKIEAYQTIDEIHNPEIRRNTPEENRQSEKAD